MGFLKKVEVEVRGEFGGAASCQGCNLISVVSKWMMKVRFYKLVMRGVDGRTATRYHLSSPSVCVGNFFSRF